MHESERKRAEQLRLSTATPLYTKGRKVIMVVELFNLWKVSLVWWTSFPVNCKYCLLEVVSRPSGGSDGRNNHPHSGSDVAPEKCETGQWIHVHSVDLSSCDTPGSHQLQLCWRGIRLPSTRRNPRQGTAQVTMVTQCNKVSWWCWMFLS